MKMTGARDQDNSRSSASGPEDGTREACPFCDAPVLNHESWCHAGEPGDQRPGSAPMVVHALNYAADLRPVFPCDERPGPRAKAPLTKNGFKDATTELNQIRYWWGKRPNALIGSPVPVGVVCIDIDPRNGATLPMLELVVGELPDTQAVLSGRMDGGIHLFFWRPMVEGDTLPTGEVVRPIDTGRLRKQFPSGIDIKTSTGYTILPPSMHPDTRAPYEWRGDHGLDDPIAHLPASLAALVLTDPNKPKHMPSGVPNQKALAGILRCMGRAKSGQRNDVLFWCARRLTGNNYPEGAFSALAEIARTTGLPDSEITKTINSARKHQA